MPKYQIILESDEIMSDEEFQKIMNLFFNSSRFKIIDARNLEGIRKELWQKQEQIQRHVDTHYEEDFINKFDEIKQLFKLD